jgi:hypothetical protein
MSESTPRNSIIEKLIEILYFGISPYKFCDTSYVDNSYPHTNIRSDLLRILFNHIDLTYIVECGSMLGNSAIIMNEELKKINKNIDIICIDPFTGDVNMWEWETENYINNRWRFLKLENGSPTIFKRFLANCKSRNLDTDILPITCTTSVGLKLLQRLYQKNKILELPNCIYLDSAHEPDETLFEISLCWNTISKGGIVFGDDWNWEAVKSDVIRFTTNLSDQEIDYPKMQEISSLLIGSEIINHKILVYQNQWVLFKL